MSRLTLDGDQVRLDGYVVALLVDSQGAEPGARAARAPWGVQEAFKELLLDKSAPCARSGCMRRS